MQKNTFCNSENVLTTFFSNLIRFDKKTTEVNNILYMFLSQFHQHGTYKQSHIKTDNRGPWANFKKREPVSDFMKEPVM